jgi:hypothetical protein
MLYTGAAALKGILSSRMYRHFLLFHTAFFILLSPRANIPDWNSLANSILRKFVNDSIKVYGIEFLVYNVHNLVHIHEDALNFGNLDKISAFPFENFMQKIKGWTHSSKFRLEQVSKRIFENQILHDEQTPKCKDMTKTSIWYSLLCKRKDNCFKIRSGEIVIFKKFVNVVNGKCTCQCQKFLYLEQASDYPIDSREMGIYIGSDLSPIINIVVEESEILCRYIRLPVGSKFHCFPLLHSIL